MISVAYSTTIRLTGGGQREVLGIEVGDSEDEAFWTAFLRHLRERGLAGVQLVISDAHAGLKKAIARCFQGYGWRRTERCALYRPAAGSISPATCWSKCQKPARTWSLPPSVRCSSSRTSLLWSSSGIR